MALRTWARDPAAGRLLTASATLLVVALAAACEPPPPGARPAAEGAGEPPVAPDEFRPAVLLDAAGRTHQIDAPPSRIVSLVPSATAVLVALGEGGRLAGRTDYDTARAAQDVPSVGGGLQPSMEALLALRPDLVIRFEGPSDRATPEQLDRLGVPHFAVRPDGIADVRRIVEALGVLTGRPTAAQHLTEEMDRQLDAVHARVASLPPVRTAFVMGGTPPMVAGPGTFIHELIRLGGGVNVFADLNDLYAPVSPEELVARRADVYLTLPGTVLDERVVRSARVREVGGGVQLPGPNLGEAAREVARALHPDAFLP